MESNKSGKYNEAAISEMYKCFEEDYALDKEDIIAKIYQGNSSQNSETFSI